MEEQKMPPLELVVHSVFGTIYRDGEFVQQGSILGLAVDTRKVVIAPVSGWVRLAPEDRHATGIKLEIRPRPMD